MIKFINIQNFKSHKSTPINLKNLTVLCGNNGVGKSSAIQLFLLLREAYIKDKSFDILEQDPIDEEQVKDIEVNQSEEVKPKIE